MTEHEKYINNLEVEIIKKGLKQKDIAVMIGSKPSNYNQSLNNFKKGKGVNFILFEKTAKVLGVPVKIFFEI